VVFCLEPSHSIPLEVLAEFDITDILLKPVTLVDFLAEISHSSSVLDESASSLNFLAEKQVTLQYDFRQKKILYVDNDMIGRRAGCLLVNLHFNFLNLLN